MYSIHGKYMAFSTSIFFRLDELHLPQNKIAVHGTTSESICNGSVRLEAIEVQKA
jgi:hypothetical protein